MSVALLPTFRFQWINPQGQPAVGYQLFTYVAGSNTPQATYVDYTQTTQNANPIILDSFGSASVWLVAGQTYKLVLQDANGNPVDSQDQVPGGIVLTAQQIGQILYPQNSAESVTPVNFQYPPEDVRRYGADPTGTVDSTTAIQNALNAHAGASVHIPAGTYKTITQLTVPSGTLLYGDGMKVSTISCSIGSINQIVTGGDRVTLRDFTINVTSVGASSQVGGVNVLNSNYCVVEKLEISGVSWAGVFIAGNSSYNVVQNCFFHNFQGTLQDSADISLSYQSGETDYNIIANNLCSGGNEEGISMLGVGPGNCAKYNLITGNRITQHTTYGILDYVNVTATDCYNQIVNNYIENIQGTTRSGQSGAGIYTAASGGMLIQGNTVINCCVQTASYGLAPAGIGINGVLAGMAPPNIVGNVIENMTKFDGILIVSSPAGANVIGNRIRMPTNTTGSGAIYVNTSSNVNVNANMIDITPTTGSTVIGVLINPTTAIANVAVNNNRILGGNGGGIRVSGSNTLSGLTISGNTYQGGGTASQGIQLANCVQAVVTGNNLISNTVAAISIAGVTQFRAANNYMTSTGTYSFTSSGTCTGSYFDKTNFWNQTVQNAGTGCIVETLSNGIPGSGTFAIGDRVEQSVPVVGNPKGWRCTVAGAVGTWVSEGNL